MKARVQRRTERERERRRRASRSGRSFGPTVCLSKHVHLSVSLPVLSSDVSPSMSSPRAPQHSACSLGFPFHVPLKVSEEGDRETARERAREINYMFQ